MSTRKDFLASSAALAAFAPASATVAAEPSPAPSASPKPEPSRPPFPALKFDLAAFDAILKVPAPHHHLITSIKLNGGEIFDAMRGTLTAYKTIGVPWSDVRLAGALYHGPAILFAFDDAMWNEYFIPFSAIRAKESPELNKDFESVTDRDTKGNPVLHRTGESKDDDSSIEALIADANPHFFVCNEAAKGFARFMAGKLKKDPIALYKDLAAHLVANTMLVPTGVWGVQAIQERGYTLLPTSL